MGHPKTTTNRKPIIRFFCFRGMENSDNNFDAIIIGSGMGGLSAATLLARDGLCVLVLEAAFSPGGCSSSYKRKGYIFESGATTLIGFDRNQPLRFMEKELGINIPKRRLNPSMSVHMTGKQITRKENQEEWINEAISHFGEAESQKKFWKRAVQVSDTVWKVSGKNHFFPPIELSDWPKLLKNNPLDVWVLPYALKSVKEVAKGYGIKNPDFYRFLDEQLLISAQATSEETPFLFGAPAITYTNYGNYYVPGGLIEMVNRFIDYIHNHNGQFNNREKAVSITKNDDLFTVQTETTRKEENSYRAPIVISNIPVWNMEEITAGEMKSYFKAEASKYDTAWGAFTMGVVTDDVYPDGMPLHHQVHVPEEEKSEVFQSDSVFVSFSHPEDPARSPNGDRVLNISTHTDPDQWFSLNGDYDRAKAFVEDKILDTLRAKLPGFGDAKLKLVFSATPVTWKNWVYRKKGRVGGIPQSMSRTILDWTPNKTPFKGLYLTGDTVYPGQGIPGVTLSGINVYYRIRKTHKKLLNH